MTVGKSTSDQVILCYQLADFPICSHSFKLLPNIGKHVVELIEGALPSELAGAWAWRPGGDALKSRRGAPAKDLSDMPGWRHDAKI